MKKLKHITAILASAALMGCGDGSKQASEPSGEGIDKIRKLENSGQLPKLDRTSTLKGIDNDDNGIRDDIDSYIASNYSSPKELAAVQQFARAIQKTLLIDTSVKAQVDSSAEAIKKAMGCRSYTFSDERSSAGSSMVYQIESMTANTKARMKQYLEFNDALDGSVFQHRSGEYFCE